MLLALDGGGYDLVLRQEVAFAAWLLVAVGLVLGAVPRGRLDGPALLAVAGFAALAVFTLLAHNWTESDERTTAELARVLQYSGFIALAYLCLNRRTWHGAAWGFVGAALVVPLFAIASRLSPGLMEDEVASLLSIDRLSHPLDYWNAVSCWGAMAIAVGLCSASHGPSSIVRSVSLALVPVAAASVYLTYSRFGVAACAIALLAAVAVSRHRWTTAANGLAAAGGAALAIGVVRGQDEIARAAGDAGAGAVLIALLAAAALCAATAQLTMRLGTDSARMTPLHARYALAASAVVALVGLAALGGPISTAWDEFRNEQAVESSDDPTSRFSSLGGTRYATWSGALDAAETDPMRGTGPGTFEFHWSREGESGEFLRDAHSLYLEELAELGVPGLVALLIGLAGLLAAAVRSLRRWSADSDFAAGAGLVASFIVFLAYAGIDWMWEISAISVLALGGIAVVGAGGFDRMRPSRLTGWQRGGLAALAVLAAGAQVPGLVATERTRASADALSAGDSAGAIELAGDAIRAEPWAASGYAVRAAAEESEDDLNAARQDLDSAISREPTNWRHFLQLARLEARAGDERASDAALAKAREEAPLSRFLIEGSPYLLGLEDLLKAARRGRADPN